MSNDQRNFRSRRANGWHCGWSVSAACAVILVCAAGCNNSSTPTEPSSSPGGTSYGQSWLGIWSGTGAFSNYSSNTSGTTGVTVTISGTGNDLALHVQTANSGVTRDFAVTAASTNSLYGGVSTTNAGSGYAATLSLSGSDGRTVSGTLQGSYQGSRYYQNVFTVMHQ